MVEKDNTHKEKYLTVTQAINELNISRDSMNTRIKNGSFPNIYKGPYGKWHIPMADIRKFKIKESNTITVEEAQKILKCSYISVLRLIAENMFPNAYKSSRCWKIPLQDIEKYQKIYENTMSTVQVMSKLNYHHRSDVRKLIERSVFPNAFKFKGNWRIPLSDLKDFKKNEEKDLTTYQASLKLNITREKIVSLINIDSFPNAYKDHASRWRIPIVDLTTFKQEQNDYTYLDGKEVCKLLGITHSALYYHLSKDSFPNSKKIRNRWKIHKQDLKDFIKKKKELKDFMKKKQELNSIKKERIMNKPILSFKKDPYLIDYLSVEDIAKELNISRSQVVHLIEKEFSLGVISYGERNWVHKDTVKEFKVKQEYIENDCLPIKEVFKRIGYAHPGNVTILVKQGKFPNAFKNKGIWIIPIKDLEKYEKIKNEYEKIKNEKIEYTPKMADKDLNKYLKKIKVDSVLLETRQLFIEFSTYKINNIKGNVNYLRSRTNSFKHFYTKLIANISSEIFNLTSEEVNNLLVDESIFTKAEKKVLLIFLRYVYQRKEITPESEYYLRNNDHIKNPKEIYSLDLFNKIYKHSKNIQTHLLMAVKKRNYANMWVYTNLLLTDFIRGQDLIINTPNIDIESIGVISIDYFKKNDLSNRQIDTVIKQLYMHFRYKRTSKTDELLTFIVSPDLKKALAYSLIISECHRRNDKSDSILSTFLEGKYNKIRPSGKISHQHFFDKLDSNFKFSSRKMNNSVATYLFYSIAEDDGQDSDLALHLTQVSRSHKNSDSTSRYIQATNRDGSINRVSYNLFRRGYFGWLYNYLSLYIEQGESIQRSLEERTQIIEEIKYNTSPRLLEGLARYSLQSTMPVKEENQTIDKFTQDIYEKKRTIISRLQDYSENEIRGILYKMSKGELPAKNEHAQCLVAPSCVKPHLSNCFSCEYVVPGNMILIQLHGEIKGLIENIRGASTDVEIKRDTRFLLHSLMIWKEARIAFGDEVVNAYIPSESVWKSIYSIAETLELK